jgi:hypothetical protein
MWGEEAEDKKGFVAGDYITTVEVFAASGRSIQVC